MEKNPQKEKRTIEIQMHKKCYNYSKQELWWSKNQLKIGIVLYGAICSTKYLRDNVMYFNCIQINLVFQLKIVQQNKSLKKD